MITETVQPEITETRSTPILQQPAAMNPMHRTDIEGFGHYEDRREMEQYAGSVGGQAYTSASQATTYAASAPTYTTNVSAGQYVSGVIPATTNSNVVSNKYLY